MKKKRKSNKGTRTARRTSKIWSNDENNLKQRSQQQTEERSQRQAEEHSQRQARPQPTAGKANQRTATETRRSTMRSTSEGQLQPAFPEASKNRCRCPAGQYELKLGKVVTTIPKIDFNIETVKYKNRSFTVQKDTEVTHGKVKGGTKITCFLKENQLEFSETRRQKDLAKKYSEFATRRGARNALCIIDYTSEDGCPHKMLTQSESTNRSSVCVHHCRFWKRPPQ